MLSCQLEISSWIGAFLFVIALAIAAPASASNFTLNLTPTALGLNTIDAGSGSLKTVNYDKEVLDDQSGLYTEAAGVGGSVLEVNGSMQASAKANGDHLVTITSETHTDNSLNVPANSDYYFGVITLTDQPGSNQNSSRRKGSKGKGSKHGGGGSESVNLGGLGLRAFESVNEVTGIRIVGAGGNANLGGSKEVSGGTDNSRNFLNDANGAPHVDELVNFDFDGDYAVDAKSVDILLTKVKFDNGDDDPHGLRIALQISVMGRGDILGDGSCTMSQLDPTQCKVYDTVNDASILITDADGNVTVNFDAIMELGLGDVVTGIRISALDDDLLAENLKETAAHFLINTLSGEFVVVPEPSTGLLMGLGIAALTLGSKRRKNLAR